MRIKYDLIGKHIGRLTVVSCCDNNMDGRSKWICKCDCGNKNVIRSTHCLIYGKNQSCGCYVKDFHKKLNDYIFNKLDNTYIGITSNGYEFIIDSEDFTLVNKYCWHQHQDGYLCTCYESYIDGGKHHNKYILMHKLILNDWENKTEIDHINGKPYDNRKENLRIVGHMQNMKNSKMFSSNTSGHKGVHYATKERKWKAYIQADNQKMHLGTFQTYEEAVIAREKAELKYFGEYNRDVVNL